MLYIRDVVIGSGGIVVKWQSHRIESFISNAKGEHVNELSKTFGIANVVYPASRDRLEVFEFFNDA
jgi:hypothetical protein